MGNPLRLLSDLLFTNPITVRLVQGGSRRVRHMYVRSAYLAALIIALMFVVLTQGTGLQNFQQLAQAGATSFAWVAYLQLGLICILSPVFMAGAIATESNPKTWDVLLTTPMSSLQIVLGQLTGRLFFVLALLACSLPLFAITQYFGGVQGRSVLLSYLVSGGAAVLVGSIAITLSVNRLAGRRAVFTFYVAVVSYLGVTLAADMGIRGLQPGLGGGAAQTTFLTAINPFLALEALLQPSTYVTPDAVDLDGLPALARFWMGSPVLAWVVVSLGASAIMLIGSSFTVRAIGARTGTRLINLRRKDANPGERYRRARLVGHNPIAWREAVARQSTPSKRAFRWAFIASGWVFGLLLVVFWHTGELSLQAYQFWLLATVYTEIAVIMLVAINTSATAISREREDGTLDLLLTTPITPKAYLGGKLLGLVRFLLPLISVPMGTIAFGALYTFVGGLGNPGGVTYTNPGVLGSVDFPAVLPEAVLIVPIVTIAFTAFCVMVGLQWSLRSKGTIASVVSTVGIVGAIGGIVGACGWNAAREIHGIGPALGALNPVSLLYATVRSDNAFYDILDAPDDYFAARVGLIVGGVVSLLVYAVVVFAIRSSMTNSFDTQTRKLAGTG